LEENFRKNTQEVCFSDVETWMSRQNGGNFPKRTGSTNDLGSPFFGYFLWRSKESDSPRGEMRFANKELIEFKAKYVETPKLIHIHLLTLTT
jgi:hypothetical protein